MAEKDKAPCAEDKRSVAINWFYVITLSLMALFLILIAFLRNERLIQSLLTVTETTIICSLLACIIFLFKPFLDRFPWLGFYFRVFAAIFLVMALYGPPYPMRWLESLAGGPWTGKNEMGACAILALVYTITWAIIPILADNDITLGLGFMVQDLEDPGKLAGGPRRNLFSAGFRFGSIRVLKKYFGHDAVDYGRYRDHSYVVPLVSEDWKEGDPLSCWLVYRHEQAGSKEDGQDAAQSFFDRPGKGPHEFVRVFRSDLSSRLRAARNALAKHGLKPGRGITFLQAAENSKLALSRKMHFVRLVYIGMMAVYLGVMLFSR